MFFKNITVYRLTAGWQILSAVLNDALAAHASVPIGASQQINHGWEPIYDDQFVHVVNRQMMLQLKTEKKVVPSSALKEAAATEIARRTQMYGRKPGKKEVREIKDEALMALLPSALPTITQTRVWIDPVNGWIVVNTASPARADLVITSLIHAVDKLELQTLHLARSITSMMTEWLLHEDGPPTNFSLDRACELKAADESKAVVKYGNSNLDNDDLRTHIKHGKLCTTLALTWEDRVSFVLTDKCKIKKIAILDVATMDREKSKDERESEDSDFVIMATELNNMLNALIEALGGEEPRDKPTEPDLF